MLLSNSILKVDSVMADVNLFGGRGGAARGGIVGRPALWRTA